MKKIYLSPSSQPENKYATGNTNEQVQCRKIASECYELLKKAGFDVKLGDSGTMHTRVSDSNEFKSDLHVAIHTNATVNHNVTGGTRIYLYKTTGEHKKVGDCVLKQLAPITIGNVNEGLVKNTSLYEIKNANALTVYIEAEFHDTKKGSDFIINNTQAIAEAIARGICEYYNVKFPEAELYRVQVGAFSKRENAEAYLKKLKSYGFNGYIVK